MKALIAQSLHFRLPDDFDGTMGDAFRLLAQYHDAAVEALRLKACDRYCQQRQNRNGCRQTPAQARGVLFASLHCLPPMVELLILRIESAWRNHSESINAGLNGSAPHMFFAASRSHAFANPKQMHAPPLPVAFSRLRWVCGLRPLRALP